MVRWGFGGRRGSHLDLLHGQVQEGVLVADADEALGALAPHAGAQPSVELHHDQLVQAVGYIVWESPGLDLIVRLDLMGGGERKERTGN